MHGLSPAVMWQIGGALVLLVIVVVTVVSSRFRDAWPPERTDNGIRVGAPKVYDTRSLSLMLEQLEQQLRTIQSIDAGGLKTALGTQQGEQRTEVLGGIAVAPMAAPSGAGATGSVKGADEKKAEDATKGGTPTQSRDGGDGASPLKW